jgi:transcriptional regulator with XRE-family HTH domain
MLPFMDGYRLGTTVRAIRIRAGWRQTDVAAAARVPRSVVARIEHGRLGEVTLEQMDTVCRALDAQIDVRIRWRGAELERLLNRDHSAMHEAMASMFATLPGWVIHILAFHERTGQLLVIELKTAIVDVNDLLGTADRKRRLARVVASARGWKVRTVSLWVVVADTGTNRRRLAEHRRVIRSALPTDGRMIRGWLAHPSQPIAAFSFLSKGRGASRVTPLAARRRVRRPRLSTRSLRMVDLLAHSATPTRNTAREANS